MNAVGEFSVRKFKDGLYYIGMYNPFIGSWQKQITNGYPTQEEARKVMSYMIYEQECESSYAEGRTGTQPHTAGNYANSSVPGHQETL